VGVTAVIVMLALLWSAPLVVLYGLFILVRYERYGVLTSWVQGPDKLVIIGLYLSFISPLALLLIVTGHVRLGVQKRRLMV
jgi:hypothetical protein